MKALGLLMLSDMRRPLFAFLIALLIGGAIGHQLVRWHIYHQEEEQLRLKQRWGY